MDNKLKGEILEKENFIFDFCRLLYINNKKKKVFDYQIIEKNDVRWLIKNIRDTNVSNEWEFYFAEPLSEEIKQNILKNLGEIDYEKR